MKLIDKNALVVEIERRMKKFTHCMSKFYYASNYNEWKLVAKEYRSLVSFINNIEEKEVDLEKEIEKQFDFHKNSDDNSLVKGFVVMNKGGFEYFAKHFFELGIKAQKGEEV